MGFLRRILGGSSKTDGTRSIDPDPPSADAADVDADERALELDLARSENERLDDLAKRQLRYARYAWTPPAQGGDRRADDEPSADDETSADGRRPDGRPLDGRPLDG